MGESFSGALEHDDSNGSPELDDAGVLDASSLNASGDLNGGMDLDAGADSSDGGSGLGPSDEQSSIIEEVSGGKRKGEEGGSSGSSKKHRWMTVDELEESRFGRSKSYGRVHCKATYKCAAKLNPSSY
ncbi:unnamed protein product [Strongylus vulgaris]|uniref:Uncharacterized protein n=1 Tax=Strongylus vulgaris TaxID=40348 RepID=A0A3P7IAI1_STRVU|nr:unnamed protein product [Strongylus vulgaris]